MVRIEVESLKVGMRLAKPLFNKNGSFLLHEGVVLDEPLIKKMSRWGCDSVCVEIEETFSA